MKAKQKGSKKIRKGDKVIATTGNFSGQTGVVLKCLGDKILVQGINLRQKHVKKSQQNPKGSIISIEKPIHVSNLKVCVGEDQPVKLKVKSDKEGNRSLCYHEGKKDVVYRSIKKQA